MSRNGSGTYNLPAGNPVVTGNTISSSWANTTLSDIASALTGSIAADGQTTPTANLVMGTYAHTGVGNATARTMYASAGQVQDSVLTYLTSVAGTNAITASAPIVMTAYATGQTFRFIAAGASTGAVTININSIGLKSIVRTDGSALVSGDIASGAAVQIMYDGTNFQLLSDANGASEAFTNLSYTGTLTGGTGVVNLGSGQFYKDASGNVGIGTASPNAKLEIAGTSIDAQLRFTATGVANTVVGFNNSGSTNFVGAVNNTSYIGNAQAYPLVFTTNTTEKMRLDASGNLGLGVTPSANSLTGSGYKALELGSIAGYGLFAGGYENYLQSNTYYNSGFKYANSGQAALQYLQSSGQHRWYTAPSGTAGNAITFTQAMTLNASGNLGVGCTPSGWTLGKVVELGTVGNSLWSAGIADIRLTANTYYNGVFRYAVTGSAAATFEIGGGAYTWRRAASGTAGNTITWTDSMTLDASGNLLVGTTSAGGVGGITVRPAIGGAGTYGRIDINQNQAADGMSFLLNGTQVGRILISTTTSYVTTSDYRLKENVAPMTGALAKIQALKPVTYNWKSDGSDGQGFIAHELAEVVPDCVSGEKDATREEEYEISPAIPAVLDEEGNEVTPAVEAVMGTRTVPVYQGIDTSFLVATLTAAIQELKAELDITKAKVATLETK